MKIVYSPTAAKEMSEIWIWNAEKYGVVWADRYLAFLQGEIRTISVAAGKDREVPKRAGLFYRVIRRRQRGHGHIVVYQVGVNEVVVLHLFHTAQNWQGRM